MRLCVSALFIALGVGCATTKNEPRLVATEIVTVPEGALVEFNGKPAGRSPAIIVLPQDEHGYLTEPAEILILPNSKQPALFPQRRILDPKARTDRVPDRLLVDMTHASTNFTQVASGRPTHVETALRKSTGAAVPYTDRGKPTQAVGLDRWTPGIY
jgi:hypothetical protein